MNLIDKLIYLEVAQWLAPRICSANRVVGGSNLTA